MSGNDGGFPIVALSYCWLTKNHPDPQGELLLILVELVELVLESCEDGGLGKEVAFFIDWCSLFQEPRSEDSRKRTTHFANEEFPGNYFRASVIVNKKQG